MDRLGPLGVAFTSPRYDMDMTDARRPYKLRYPPSIVVCPQALPTGRRPILHGM